MTLRVGPICTLALVWSLSAETAMAAAGIFGGLSDTLRAAIGKANLKDKTLLTKVQRILADAKAKATEAAHDALVKAHRDLRKSARAAAEKHIRESRARAQGRIAAAKAERERLAAALQAAIEDERKQAIEDAEEAEDLAEKLRAFGGIQKAKPVMDAAIAASKKLVAAFNAGAAARKARRAAKCGAVSKILARIREPGKSPPPKARPPATDNRKAHRDLLQAAIERSAAASRAALVEKLRAILPAGQSLFKAVQDFVKSNPVKPPNWVAR